MTKYFTKYKIKYFLPSIFSKYFNLHSFERKFMTKYFFQVFLSSISIYTHLQENLKNLNQYISRITQIKQNLALWWHSHLHLPNLARLFIHFVHLFITFRPFLSIMYSTNLFIHFVHLFILSIHSFHSISSKHTVCFILVSTPFLRNRNPCFSETTNSMTAFNISLKSPIKWLPRMQRKILIFQLLLDF